MNKICTDIKQSKRLIELGIDLNAADMCYMYRHWEIDEDSIGGQTDAHIGFSLGFYDGADNGKTYHYIPAWSLSALFKLIPKCISTKNGNYFLRMRILDGNYSFYYDGLSDTHLLSSDTPLDAVFQMVCWLKENGKI